MKVLICGGRLQGVELCYLAAKAGWRSIVIDRDRQAPAFGLCDEFIAGDFRDARLLRQAMAKADFVVPALEHQATLAALACRAEETGVPFAHDAAAYRISSCKKTSDALFAKLGVAAPRPWPDCSFPITVKPSAASGSKGVRLLKNAGDFDRWRAATPDYQDYVCQEYLAGPSYSLEITGRGGRFQTYAVTKLEMDAAYDCKRVSAPVVLPDEAARKFRRMATTIAQAINLTGIMDVEVIQHAGELKALEIDARFPSQTPSVVYHATGVNLMTELWRCFAPAPSETPGGATNALSQSALYEHIQISGAALAVQGEHVMATARPLTWRRDFFGADEALSDYQPGRADWVATLIFLGENPAAAWAKRQDAIARICRDARIRRYTDASPAPPAFSGADAAAHVAIDETVGGMA
ncbi:MAG: 3-methylornithine--L-lysine ligase PylC [Desulfobulbaceae bacterium]|jgi:pyrrolysine biosynthesis protein PylC|nr:3-methylornithine--L-lysine ligase PylC [Desulfobulbaceae bacterium]